MTALLLAWGLFTATGCLPNPGLDKPEAVIRLDLSTPKYASKTTLPRNGGPGSSGPGSIPEGTLSRKGGPATTGEEITERIRPVASCRLCREEVEVETLHLHWELLHKEELIRIEQWLRETQEKGKTWEEVVDETEGRRLAKMWQKVATRKVL